MLATQDDPEFRQGYSDAEQNLPMRSATESYVQGYEYARAMLLAARRSLYGSLQGLRELDRLRAQRSDAD